MKISSRPLCCDTGNRLTDDVWTTSIWRTGSGWAVNERTNEGTGCGEAWPNDFACYTWIVIFLSFFYFCALPWGWTSAFFIAVVMPLSTGRKFSFFFYSHPLVDLRDRIFNLRQFFIFFSLWGVNNSICLNLNYSCSHPWMFHPPEKKQFFLRWNMFPNDFSPLERIKRKFHLGLFAA